MGHLVISQSTRDKAQALKVLEHLESSGYDVFLDSDPGAGIGAGLDWEKELYRKLNIKREPTFEAVAPTGAGVFDTLKAVARQVLMDLRKR